MTRAIVEHLANLIKANLPFDNLQFVGRKTADGLTVENGEYVGIDDRKGRYGYFRYTGEQDHKYEKAGRLTSRASWYNVTSELRFVGVVSRKDCGTATQLEQQLSDVLNSATFPSSTFGKVNIELQSSSTDIEKILREETDKEEVRWTDSKYLVALDFEIAYVSNKCCEVEVPVSGDCPAATYTVFLGEEVFETGTVAAGGEVAVNVPEAPDATWELRDFKGNLVDSGTVAPGGLATIAMPECPTVGYAVYVGGLLFEEGTVNAGAELVVNVPGCEDARWELRDSGGTLLDSGIIEAGGTQAITAPDGVVSYRNTDNSIQGVQAVKSGRTEEIVWPDTPVTVEDDGGVQLYSEPLPSGVPKLIVVPAASGGACRASALPAPTNSEAAEGAAVNAYVPGTFHVLDENNPFGHNWRRTGVTGGYYDFNTSEHKDKNGAVTTAALAYPGDLFIDWAQWNEGAGRAMMYHVGVENASSEHEPAIAQEEAATYAGYNDWFLPSDEMYWAQCRRGGFTRLMNYPPINCPNIRYYWTSTKGLDGDGVAVGNAWCAMATRNVTSYTLLAGRWASIPDDITL